MMTFTPHIALLLLAGGAANELAFENARPTYGYLGATRNAKGGILPGDILHFTFDVKNLTVDSKGNAAYSLAAEVLNDQGKTVFGIPPYNSIARNFFGGTSLPCSANLEIPLDTKPGAYTLRVIFEDR